MYPHEFNIQLPDALLDDKVVTAMLATGLSATNIKVPNNYEALLAAEPFQSEVLAIQRLLTLPRLSTGLKVIWGDGIAKRVVASPAIYPMLAVLLLIHNAQHEVVDMHGQQFPLDASKVRNSLAKYQLKADLFADTQILACADSRGYGRPPDLYDPKTGKLRSRDDFETMVVDILARQIANDVERANSFSFSMALGVIVAELFENTDMHGKLELTGAPVKPNGIRGLVIKRIKVLVPQKKIGKGKPPMIDAPCLELSVFDSGIGYYPSYSKRALTKETDLKEEWKVLHNCLERHYYPELADSRVGHRAMGLYEVLRALNTLNGKIEIRTGRLFAYRSFLKGDLPTQMEAADSPDRPGRPKPKLVDVEKQYLAIPSANEVLIGSSVRVIVPLD